MKMKLLESASHLALITVCLLGAYRLWQYNPQTSNSVASTQLAAPTSVAGRLPIDLNTRNRWLVLVLSTECRYCIESAPFYQELVRMVQNADIGVVAVFPQNQQEVEQYELTHKVTFPKTVTGFSLTQLQIRGTPTMLLVDRNGNVLKHWSGLLSETAQGALRAELGLKKQT